MQPAFAPAPFISLARPALLRLRPASALLRLHTSTQSYSPRQCRHHPPRLLRFQTLATFSQPSPPSPPPPPPPSHEATLQDLKAFLKQKSSTRAFRKVANTMLDIEASTGPYGHLVPDADVYRLAVRTLLRELRTDLAFAVYELRIAARARRPGLGDDVGLAASVIRGVLRDGKKRKQVELDAEVLYKEIKDDCRAPGGAGRKAKAVCGVIGALLEGQEGKRVLREGRVRDAVRMAMILKGLSEAGGAEAAVGVRDYNNCIRLFGKRRRVDCVFVVLDAMRATGVERDNETFEFLANAVVRQVEFVTGAVSMATLPEALPAEVAFVGRSNVGKSSLVNMICNRKALAYVSGRPGKTQQFNYFLVNGADQESSFYLVDLPGVGYAKVAKTVQADWLAFMDRYLVSRPSLEVIFHLIDGRHGALADDNLLMQRVANSDFEGQYVLVVTKMDKLDKQKVKQSMLDKTRSTLVENGCSADTPILLTSSASKLGRDEIWRYLRQALYKQSVKV